MKAYGKSDVGLMRTINQDSIFVSMSSVGKLPNLFIVADGMGGHKAGDVASRKSIEEFINGYFNEWLESHKEEILKLEEK